MSETPAPTEAETTSAYRAQPATPAPSPREMGAVMKEQELTIRSLFEAGVHYGHQPGRWNPQMRSYIFGERNGTHILDLDQTLPMLSEALEFLRDTAAGGGSILFVGTKRQAAAPIMTEAQRSKQFYVNNRWLGGMLTNWKTVRKSIERYNGNLEILGSEEKKAELSKKELAAVSRETEKYSKSLEGIRKMDRLPSALFIIDVGKESIAVQEAKRLCIPIVGIVDSNNSPRDIDFVVPGNDDAIRAIDLYCTAAGNACLEGYELHQAELAAQRRDRPQDEKPDLSAKTGRRVVEIKQAPRRGRGSGAAGGGRSYSAGGHKGGDEAAAPATPAPSEGEQA
ncbi:MAG: 30S ribosomal protein S2 [Myxococcota bacterium]